MYRNSAVNGIRPTLKPGQTLENTSNKFSYLYDKTGYYEASERLLDPFQTDAKKMSETASNFEEFRKSFEAT